MLMDSLFSGISRTIPRPWECSSCSDDVFFFYADAMGLLVVCPLPMATVEGLCCLEALFCSDSGSLARVTPLVLRGIKVSCLLFYLVGMKPPSNGQLRRAKQITYNS